MSDREGFLDRWSRRKLAEKTRAEEDDSAAAPTDSDDEAAIAAHEAEAQERHPAEEIDIDSLTPDSDYSVFLQKGVSAATRRKALRMLWSNDPLYAGKELLSDNFDLADVKTWGLGSIRDTAWKVGEGYGRKVAQPDMDDDTAAEAASASSAPVESGEGTRHAEAPRGTDTGEGAESDDDAPADRPKDGDIA